MGSGQKEKNLYTKTGEVFQHVVATNGKVDIDFSPYAEHPAD